MSDLILVRGLPGSGKSTFATMLAKEHGYMHMEADMYFLNSDNEYQFDASKLGQAHAWCLETTRMLLKRRYKVVVSNTFTRFWELEKYLKLDTEVKILKATGEYPNIHGVPKDTVAQMRERWEDISDEILIEDFEI